MKRKLYALFILIGAIGSLLLAYLFFFVYYTGTLTVNANVDDYRVELFSPGTAQKWTHDCPEMICVIPDVSPFDYNISIIKPEHEVQVLGYKVRPRGNETLVVELKKQVRLDPIDVQTIVETSQQKIQRIRDENLYFAVFRLDDNETIRFIDEENELLLQYITNNEVKDIQSFGLTVSSDIQVENIYSSSNIHISLGNENYIFDTSFYRLYKFPAIKDLQYIKYDTLTKKYIVITDVGAFVYDQGDNSLEFQYLFKDYLNVGVFTIGVIFSQEEQKKNNFNISSNGNVIIKYSQQDKTRDEIYSTGNKIDQIYQDGQKIMIVSGNIIYELKNFD